MTLEQRAAQIGLVRKAGETDEALTARCLSAETASRAAAAPVIALEFDHARNAGQSEGVTQERARQVEITTLFAAPNYQGATFAALRESCIAKGSTIEQAREQLLALVGGAPAAPVNQPGEAGQSVTVRSVDDESDKKRDAMTASVMHRSGLIDADDKKQANIDIRSNPYAGYTFSELAREALTVAGFDTRGLNQRQIVGAALNPMQAGIRSGFVGNSTSAFPALVADIANKSMMKGFSESEETWRLLASIGSVSSFRSESRVAVSEFGDLDEIAENGEYKHGKMTDRAEYIQAKKYGKLFAITREMIVNDDLNGMMKVASAMGRAADRKVGNLFYAVLTGNPALADGVNLFHADHNNVITSGAVPSVSQLNAMMVLMALQTDSPDENAVGQNRSLSKLVVPIALKSTANVLASAVNDPDQKSTQKGGGGTSPNPFANTFEVVADARLDADSSTQYYGMANPAVADLIEVAFLDGNENPYLESEQGFNVDGITYKVRHEVGVAPLDFRGMVRNAGA